MVLAVPAQHWSALEKLCRSEGVEAAILGIFEATGRLHLSYNGQVVGDLSMEFLHDGLPPVVRKAEFVAPPCPVKSPASTLSPLAALQKILSSYTVCSKEWVIRQYDHEVQGGSVIKPLTGIMDDGPSDAAIVMPVLGSWTGLAIGCGSTRTMATSTLTGWPHLSSMKPFAMSWR